MASAICIITSTGLKCLSSPLKEHHPGATACGLARPNPARDTKVALLKRSLKEHGIAASQRNLIARVVEVMLAANLDSRSRFTIVKAR